MSLFWFNFLSETEDVQAVAIVCAPDLVKSLMVAHHVGLPVDGYRMHIFGPFKEDAVATYWWERLLTPYEADELNLSRALTDERVFDFYSDVPREPEASGDPQSAATPTDEASPKDAG